MAKKWSDKDFEPLLRYIAKKSNIPFDKVMEMYEKKKKQFMMINYGAFSSIAKILAVKFNCDKFIENYWYVDKEYDRNELFGFDPSKTYPEDIDEY